MLLAHAAQRPAHPAIREKDLGIWQTTTWAELRAEVEAIAAGLATLGFRRGEHLALVGENRPRLYAAMIAAQVLGGVPVPLYQDAVAQELTFVFQNAEIRFAIAENQEQVDKLLEIKSQWPALAHVVYDDPRGLRNYHQPELLSFESLLERGRQHAAANPGFMQAEIDRGSPEDVAAMFYTSGTTGFPKGVIHTHRNLITMSALASKLDGLSEREDVIAYLPMAWIGQNIFSYAQWLVCGFTVNCPESAATVTNDMREIGPTYYFAPPRVLEALLTQVTIRMEDAASIKRAMYRYFMDVARRVGGRLLDRDPSVTLSERIRYALGDLLVYGPLRNNLGMSKVRVAYTAGEAIGPDLFVFYRSLGINLKQLYGSTETAVFVCVQPDGQVKPDTVGPPVPGVEVKIAPNGEILIRSPGLLREYYKNPQATAEVKDAEGFFHTGDAGYFDADGHLKIIDRAKDVGKLADGSLFAPKYIENKLKFFPYIKEAVAFGAGRDRVMAMVNIDFDACGNWAERRGIAFSGYNDLASRPEIYELVGQCIEQVNADLAADTVMCASQVHRYLILHKELDADDEELTRTRKVRRGFIGQKYQVLVDALYGGRKEQFIETKVRFEDGRVGSVSATLRVADAKTYSPIAAQRKAA
ncbi:MAG TPA: AMP-binding protein [Burkholderiaceae bacterium]|nr:AMP-binding protein [Burkholderiaceae bacterium]